MNFRRLLCLSLVSTAALAPAAALGQEAPLTIARAIELAETRNERALQAEARADAAEARLARARTFFFPDLDVTGTYTRRAYESVRNIGGEEVTIQSFNALNGNATLSQTLFDARAFPLLRQARYSFQAAKLASADALR
ncbi:MAG TPA: TolC family protein, partial [Thermoanaerobaculia bacterium]